MSLPLTSALEKPVTAQRVHCNRCRQAQPSRLSGLSVWRVTQPSLLRRTTAATSNKDVQPGPGLPGKAEEEVEDLQQTVTATVTSVDLDKEVSKFARNAATTFAPRASGVTKNPAYKGSVLYRVFEVQAWASLVVGGLLSYNLIFPSDKPDIARLIGMWSLWMFTIPSLRARDCAAAEKDALNLLFLAVPLVNITLPLVWKSFPFIYTMDVIIMAAVYAWKVGLPTDEQA